MWWVYAILSALFASLTAIFGKLGVANINSNLATGIRTVVISEMKIEFLYWFAILTSSTFGTTSGDFLSNDTPLGADGGTILLIALLIVSILLLRYKQISKDLFYWLAIIIIHPIGATFGNYISKPAGLNFGNVFTSIFLIILFSIVYNINQKPKNETN